MNGFIRQNKESKVPRIFAIEYLFPTFEELDFLLRKWGIHKCQEK